jgi:hypothetical protein
MKEEPKQKTLNMNTHYVDFSNPNANKIFSASTTTIKQETLEEVAEKYAERKSSSSVFQEAHKNDFIEGAKWQQERMYSEEEVIKIVEKSRETGLTAEFLLLTEQFKKK